MAWQHARGEDDQDHSDGDRHEEDGRKDAAKDDGDERADHEAAEGHKVVQGGEEVGLVLVGQALARLGEVGDGGRRERLALRL